jgi:hypothetical protein
MANQRVASRLTPPDATYPSCETTYVKLLVYLDQGDFASVTNTLGIDPTQSQNRGETFVNSLGRHRTAKTTYWCISSEGKVASKDVRHHLDWLLELLDPRELALARLQRMPGVKMAVTCVWWSADSGDIRSGGPTLWPEQMARLARLNLECGFDIYYFFEDEEQSRAD